MEGKIVETFCNITNIIISFLGFVVLCVEVGIMIQDQKNHTKELKIQEAIEISDRFKNLISKNLSFIHGVFDNSEYVKVMEEISDVDLKFFDKEEFDELANKHPRLNKYWNLGNSMCLDNFNKIASMYLATNTPNSDEYTKINFFNQKNWQLTKSEENALKSKNMTKNSKEIFNQCLDMKYYRDKISQRYFEGFTDTLNELEELCMALNKGIVDEETVYQSLHQIVIITIKNLYPVICNVNKANNSYDKYYTHTISLYNRWVERRDKAKKEENKNRNIVHSKIL